MPTAAGCRHCVDRLSSLRGQAVAEVATACRREGGIVFLAFHETAGNLGDAVDGLNGIEVDVVDAVVVKLATLLGGPLDA